MPRLARLYLKAGLLYLVAAFVVGVLIQARTVIDLPSGVATLQPVYIHLLVVGWITQLIIGVGYWMFPKFTKENPRGSEGLAWATFVLLNVGLLLRVISEPSIGPAADHDLGWMLALSGVLQMLAGWLFVINTWPRIKER